MKSKPKESLQRKVAKVAVFWWVHCNTKRFSTDITGTRIAGTSRGLEKRRRKFKVEVLVDAVSSCPTVQVDAVSSCPTLPIKMEDTCMSVDDGTMAVRSEDSSNIIVAIFDYLALKSRHQAYFFWEVVAGINEDTKVTNSTLCKVACRNCWLLPCWAEYRCQRSPLRHLKRQSPEALHLVYCRFCTWWVCAQQCWGTPRLVDQSTGV